MLTLALLLQAAASPAPAAKAPSEIVAAAPAADWVDIAADDLLVMQLAPDAAGKPRRVLIQLMPPPFSQPWIANIRTLAKAHWWDGTSVNRVQDNYVAQWGDATEKKPLPDGLSRTSEQGYAATSISFGRDASTRDAYAWTRAMRGWPLASDGRSSWPVHCYGMVGVGRNLSPDAGSGAELYTVIGHAPRHLDRNIAVVGRVVEGIEHLSSLPRGSGGLGFYEDPKERVPVTSIRLASELPETERPRMQYLSTESATFAAYADARANRRDAFFIVPAGGADICNIPVPVRKRP
jgi:peptidylprolyl isomerase